MQLKKDTRDMHVLQWVGNPGPQREVSYPNAGDDVAATRRHRDAKM
jgi:hypothetical protein